ncbi:MAG TPA: GNAT family N-acetyltransferase [Rummeliibacillus sp.]|nr:GNAT family N-acetyltransferase [Rummeliibacillus sp.]
MKYNIEVLLKNENEFSSFLENMIREFNNKHSIHHKQVRNKGSVQPINIIVSDDRKEWGGGIDADVYWDWVEINNFWFKEEFRGKGLGGLLLEKTEQIAKEKGATKALLTTFEFQVLVPVTETILTIVYKIKPLISLKNKGFFTIQIEDFLISSFTIE